MAEEKNGYEVLRVKIQEEWQKGEKPPIGIRQAKDKEGNFLDFYEVRVPRGVELNGNKIGGSTFTVPASVVKDIDPTHEKAKDYEKEEGYAETHKKIVASKDFEITFNYQNKNENGEFERKEAGKGTLGEYKGAIRKWKEANKKYQEERTYENPEHDAIKSNRKAADAEVKEVARIQDNR